MPPTRLGQSGGIVPTSGGISGRGLSRLSLHENVEHPRRGTGRHEMRAGRRLRIRPAGPDLHVLVRTALRRRARRAVVLRCLTARRVVIVIAGIRALLVGHGRDGCAMRTGRPLLTSRRGVRDPGDVFTVVARHRRRRAAHRRGRLRFGARGRSAGGGCGAGFDGCGRRVVDGRGRGSRVGCRRRPGIDGRLQFRARTMRSAVRRDHSGRCPRDSTARNCGDGRRGQLPCERYACHREPFGRSRS
jgi:hypothetical protein